MNKNKLKSHMALHGDTGTKLSEDMELSQACFSAKLNGKIDFKQGEIRYIIDRYNLNADETSAIFFSKEVS